MRMIRFLGLLLLALVLPTLAIAQETNVNLGGLHNILAPYIFTAVSAAVIALLTWATSLFKQWTGIQIEAKHREALHSAIMTGVAAALAKSGKKASEVVVDAKSPYVAEAVKWAYASVPDALKYLGVTPEALAEIAKSKLVLLAEAPAGTAPATPAK